MGSACSSYNIPLEVCDQSSPHAKVKPHPSESIISVYDDLTPGTKIPTPRAQRQLPASSPFVGAQYQPLGEAARSSVGTEPNLRVRQESIGSSGVVELVAGIQSSTSQHAASHRNPLVDSSSSFALGECSSRSVACMNSSDATGVLSLGFDPPLASRNAKPQRGSRNITHDVTTAATTETMTPAIQLLFESQPPSLGTSQADPLSLGRRDRSHKCSKVLGAHDHSAAQFHSADDDACDDDAGSLGAFLGQRGVSFAASVDGEGILSSSARISGANRCAHQPPQRSPSLASAASQQQHGGVVSLLVQQHSEASLKSDAIGIAAGSHATSSVWSMPVGSNGHLSIVDTGRAFKLPTFSH